MTGELSVQWSEHFVSYIKHNVEEKVFLLLDGHASHKNLHALEYAKQHGVVVMCLPLQCTHRLKPLDIILYLVLRHVESIHLIWIYSVEPRIRHPKISIFFP
jgi:hypothetical protein